jgi:hypothetical protein
MAWRLGTLIGGQKHNETVKIIHKSREANIIMASTESERKERVSRRDQRIAAHAPDWEERHSKIKGGAHRIGGT